MSGAVPPTERMLRSGELDDVEDPSGDGAWCGADPKDGGRSSGAVQRVCRLCSSLSLADRSGLNGLSSSELELESFTSSSRGIDDFPSPSETVGGVNCDLNISGATFEGEGKTDSGDPVS